MSDTHCTVYPSMVAGGRPNGCGQKFEYYITPFPSPTDRETIEKLTRLPYKEVAWG